MSQHQSQVVSVIQRAVQTVIIRGLNDPRVRGMISVTKVEITPDYREAMVYVSVLPAKHADLTMHGLRAAAKHIRHQVGQLVRLRRMPILSIRLDHSFRKQTDVLAAIAAVSRERMENETAGSEGDEKVSNHSKVPPQ